MTKKKIYIKPQLEATEIDYEISLVMMTSPPPGPGSAMESQSTSQTPVQTNAPSYESDPFGGSSPDYSN